MLVLKLIKFISDFLITVLYRTYTFVDTIRFLFNIIVCVRVSKLNRLKRDFHFTYIFISHDLGVVRFMSDRVVVMYNGKIQELNEADLLFNDPQNDYTKKLIAALP